VPDDAVRGSARAPSAAGRAERRRERLGAWGSNLCGLPGLHRSWPSSRAFALERQGVWPSDPWSLPGTYRPRRFLSLTPTFSGMPLLQVESKSVAAWRAAANSQSIVPPSYKTSKSLWLLSYQRSLQTGSTQALSLCWWNNDRQLRGIKKLVLVVNELDGQVHAELVEQKYTYAAVTELEDRILRHARTAAVLTARLRLSVQAQDVVGSIEEFLGVPEGKHAGRKVKLRGGGRRSSRGPTARRRAGRPRRPSR
jgi:hypothetical protein